jgi:hypothetical protein
MRTVCFLITIECPDETPNSDMDKLKVELEDIVYKNNYELYDSEWYDE